MVLNPRRIRCEARSSTLVLFSLLLSGCGSGQRVPAKDAPPRHAEPVGSDSAIVRRDSVARVPTIGSDGVGELVVGQAIPSALLDDAQHYAGFYADAQPLEGFEIDAPPVLAIVRGGPFQAFGEQHPGQSPPDALRARTRDLARKGEVVVGMIVIRSPKLHTEQGVHVGMRTADVRAAYPHAEALALPALWEEPTCVLRAQRLWFFFDRCEPDRPAADANLIRIVVRDA